MLTIRRHRLLTAVAGLLTITSAAVAAQSLTGPTSATAAAPLPVRVLDTRTGAGVPGNTAAKLVPGQVMKVSLAAAETGGATSAVLNLTATNAATAGWVRAWPCASSEPATSTLNFIAGQVAANAVVLRLDATGMCLTASTAVDVIADLTGSFGSPEGFVGTSPARILDTRQTNDPLISGVERRLKVGGTPGIPASAGFVALNLTAAAMSEPGWLVAYPCGQPTNSSTVNFAAGEDVANLTFVGVTNGEVCLRSYRNVDLIVDTYGYGSGSAGLRVGSPVRLLDTRDHVATPGGALQSGATISLPVAGRGGVPLDAAEAFVTVTITNPTGVGYVTTWPCDQPLPYTSTINPRPGLERSNLALTTIASDGTVCFNLAAQSTPMSVDLIVDVVGWTTGGPARQPYGGIVNSSINCGLQNPAFCDSFDVAKPVAGTRSGDLDPLIWGVSRSSFYGSGKLNQWLPATLAGASVLPPNDVRIINGRLLEAVADHESQPILAMYPKQPFNIEGRTGKVTFDVSADTQGSHAAWPEFWWTDQPVPNPNDTSLSGHAPMARNSLGVKFTQQCTPDGFSTGENTQYVSVGSISVTRGYKYSDVPVTHVACVREGSSAALNHFEIRINANRVEVWGTDPNSPVLRFLAYANVQMPLTQGLIWIEDVHYNACKFDTQCDHTFTWDNVGFDGPKTYRDLSFDVPDAMTPSGGGSVELGYAVPPSGRTLTVQNVHHGDKVPTGAYVLFGTHFDREIPSVSVNGAPAVATAWPGGDLLEIIAVPIDPALVHDGSNTITFTSQGSGSVDNVNLVLVNAASVP